MNRYQRDYNGREPMYRYVRVVPRQWWHRPIEVARDTLALGAALLLALAVCAVAGLR